MQIHFHLEIETFDATSCKLWKLWFQTSARLKVDIAHLCTTLLDYDRITNMPKQFSSKLQCCQVIVDVILWNDMKISEYVHTILRMMEFNSTFLKLITLGSNCKLLIVDNTGYVKSKHA